MVLSKLFKNRNLSLRFPFMFQDTTFRDGVLSDIQMEYFQSIARYFYCIQHFGTTDAVTGVVIRFAKRTANLIFT